MTTNLTFFATTPKGMESLLAVELRRLGAASIRETRAGVTFEGELIVAYRACLWSRLANRILLPLNVIVIDFSYRRLNIAYNHRKVEEYLNWYIFKSLALTKPN